MLSAWFPGTVTEAGSVASSRTAIGGATYVVTWPLQYDVFASAPAQLKLKCTWSLWQAVVPLQEYGSQWSSPACQIRAFQMMYMTPVRRAIACRLPYLSVANSQCSMSLTWLTCAELVTLAVQSKARPSLCSLVPPSLQGRVVPLLPVPGYAFSTMSRNLATPGCVAEMQEFCGW